MVARSVEKNLNKERKIENDGSKSELTIISASDVERFGYCPMSWWLKYEGLMVYNESLKKGTEEHKKLIKNVSKVKQREKLSQTSEFNIKLFAFIAIILAINAIVILYPTPLLKDFLVYLGLLWLFMAIIYYFYYLFRGEFKRTDLFFENISSDLNEKSTKEKEKKSKQRLSLFQSTPQTWKQSAIYFIIIAGGLAFNGISLLSSDLPELMSRIYLVSALLWLLGTGVILYFVLRSEQKDLNLKKDISVPEKRTRFSLSKSEKLIISFAIVATLLAINGLSIRYRDNFEDYSLVVLIQIGFAALWLGVSFAFIYLSIRSGVLLSNIAKDFSEATTESKRYRIMIEKISVQSLSRSILVYNWPLLFTIVAIILGINSILLMYVSSVFGNQADILSRFLIIIALLWLFGAFIFLYDVLKNTELARELRRLHGIYQGKIEYTDRLDNKSKMLFSKINGLRGKPDYIVKIKGKFIPVEIKTGKIPKGPHFSHIIQIAAYCLLIQENYKIRPPFGIISYSKEAKHKIKYDENLENLLIEKLDEMRQCIDKNEAHRNHNRAGKCRSCSRRKNCPERLI